jgi:hypothetical protein
MRHILSFLFALAMFGRAVFAFAQDSGEPIGNSAAASEPQDGYAPYTPILISLVPGISFPLGLYDVSIAGGMIGSMVGNVSGVEGSEVFNFSKNLRGVQGAGVLNIAKSVKGAQGAGIFNIADDVNGIQGSGVFNIADDSVSGIQGSGIFNIAKSISGVQGSGVFNISKERVVGVQGSGVFNMAASIRGVQGAGLFNISGEVDGCQGAGLFNSAGNVKGLQVGLVNIADTIDGAQIGLVNIAGNGIHALSLMYEPATSYVYGYWQLGTPYLYTIAGFGAPYDNWSFDFGNTVASLGLGSRARIFDIYIDVDVSAEQAIGSLPYGSFDWRGDWSRWAGWSMIRPYHSAKITVGLPICRDLQIFVGLKADMDIDALGDRVPEALQAGSAWKGSLFDGGFTVWPKWFFGIKVSG